MLAKNKFFTSVGLVSIVCSVSSSNIGFAKENVEVKCVGCREGFCLKEGVKESGCADAGNVIGGRVKNVFVEKPKGKVKAVLFELLGKILGHFVGATMSVALTSEIVRYLKEVGKISRWNYVTTDKSMLGGTYFTVNGDASVWSFLFSVTSLTMLFGKIGGFLGGFLDKLVF